MGPLLGPAGPLTKLVGPPTCPAGPLTKLVGPLTFNSGQVVGKPGPLTGKPDAVLGNSDQLAGNSGRLTGQPGPVIGNLDPVVRDSGPRIGRAGQEIGDSSLALSKLRARRRSRISSSEASAKGPMPRSNRVPKADGSMALQSSLAALRSSFSSTRVGASRAHVRRASYSRAAYAAAWDSPGSPRGLRGRFYATGRGRQGEIAGKCGRIPRSIT